MADHVQEMANSGFCTLLGGNSCVLGVESRRGSKPCLGWIIGAKKTLCERENRKVLVGKNESSHGTHRDLSRPVGSSRGVARIVVYKSGDCSPATLALEMTGTADTSE